MDCGNRDVANSCNINPEQRNYSNGKQERGVLIHILRQLEAEHTAGISIPYSQNPAVTTIAEERHRTQIGDTEQHLVSSVTARLVSTLYPFTLQDCIYDRWEFENLSENVEIRELYDGRWLEENVLHVRYLNDITTEEIGEDNRITALAENTILLRRIWDFGHQLDPHPLSLQIIWSSKFNWRQIIQQLEDNTYIFDFKHETISLNMNLIDDVNALVKATLAMKCLSTVIVSHDDGDELLCVICHELLSTGGSVKQLPCNHRYHSRCIYSWFSRQISCPMCRDETVSDST